jgi:Ca-activated chloride channel family protein
MRTAPAGVLWLLASSVLSAAALDGAAAQRTFRSGVDMVMVGATVFDRKGNHLTDLGAGDFEVYEDGQKQAVQVFFPCDAQTGGERPASPVDLHLGALLDISGSMDRDLQFARRAAIAFLGSRPEARDFTLVQVESRVRVSQFSQAEFGRMVEQIRIGSAEGETALWDAVGVYLDTAARQAGRKVLLLYTDGGDNASSLTFRDLQDLLKASDVTVEAIGLMQHQRQDSVAELRQRLQALAEMTGGQAFFPLSAADLDKAYAQVAAEIDAQYTLGYQSSHAQTDGKWRKVEIKVTRPGLTGIKVRARQGYFAPMRPAGRLPGV